MSNQPSDNQSDHPVLRRYTNLAATIHHLKTKTITLLDPATWDDRNDTFFLEQYKLNSNAKSVLALCFSLQTEKYHHWKVFSGGEDGVCIEFNKQLLLNGIGDDPRYAHKSVTYKTIKQVRQTPQNTQDLPFLKRIPYIHDAEYRIVFTDIDHAAESIQIHINIGWIKQITLSPWMPEQLVKSVQDVLKNIHGCKSLAIHRSTLIENERWKKAAQPSLN